MTQAAYWREQLGGLEARFGALTASSLGCHGQFLCQGNQRAGVLVHSTQDGAASIGFNNVSRARTNRALAWTYLALRVIP